MGEELLCMPQQEGTGPLDGGGVPAMDTTTDSDGRPATAGSVRKYTVIASPENKHPAVILEVVFVRNFGFSQAWIVCKLTYCARPCPLLIPSARFDFQIPKHMVTRYLRPRVANHPYLLPWLREVKDQGRVRDLTEEVRAIRGHTKAPPATLSLVSTIRMRWSAT